jgi:hypothetical protein
MQLFFHNKTTISARRFAKIVDDDRKELVKRFWFPCPKKFLEKKHNQLIEEYHDAFNGDQVNRMYDYLTDQLYLEATINLYRIIYWGLVIRNDERCRKEFEEELGFEPENKEHIEFLAKETMKLVSQHKEAQEKEKQRLENQAEKKKDTFYTTVASTAVILAIPIDFSIKLVEFYAYYILALDKAQKINEHGKD